MTDVEQTVIGSQNWYEDKVASAKRLNKMACYLVTVTPGFASWILENCNTRNRNWSTREKKAWVKKLSNGEYMLTSQAISVGIDGILNEGQHRLYGVKASGVSIDIPMWFGESVKAFHVMNIGLKRSAGQALTLAGYENAIALAAVVRMARNIEEYGPGSNEVMDNNQVLAYAEANPDIITANATNISLRAKIDHGGAGLGAALFFIYTKTKHRSRYDEFVNHLLSGANLDSTDAVLVLREGLRGTKSKWNNHIVRTQLRASAIAASTILAWNAWLKHRPIKRESALRWQEDDAFPSPI